ncbi:hypothetical protein [Salinactinospora qingdaonensis]|uniref:hypothetical protein n=1 Tax=Salinactinospora qingdaonensis TaxID=702744 RepID=UPI0031EF9B44
MAPSPGAWLVDVDVHPRSRLARKLYVSTCCEDRAPLSPIHALLFADTGMSPGAISSLVVVWSVTSLVLELPSGLWADICS